MIFCQKVEKFIPIEDDVWEECGKYIMEKRKEMLVAGMIIMPIALIVMILFFTSDCFAMATNIEEAKVYRYALECVEDDLKYPHTATYPSFKETTIRKSVDSAKIILEQYQGGKSCEYAWDVSGSGTCENALGMKVNYRFTVTVVMSKDGELWCYNCYIN